MGSYDVKVAVLDTGINYDHPDLEDNVVDAWYVDDVAANGIDGHNHGSHVSGVIAAIADNNKGGCGVAPDVGIISVKVLDDEGSGTTSSIMQGIYIAVNAAGADIINMSLGGYFYHDLYQEAVTYAANRGIPVIVAAGNDGTNIMCYPAAFSNVICVGAVNQDNSRAHFSNYGPWVDVCAPGVSIPSTGCYDGDSYESYVVMSGTSQATPVVSGVAALIMTVYGKDVNHDGARNILDTIAVENLLKSTATKAASPNIGGVVNAQKVLQNVVNKPVISLKVDGAAWDPKVPFLSGHGEITITSGDYETIYYTLDGKTPTQATGIEYTGPFTLTGTGNITVKAISVNNIDKVSTLASAVFKLTQPVESITINGSPEVAINKSIQLNVVVEPSHTTNKKVTWSIPDAEDKLLAAISSSGKLTAKSTPGVVTVRATAADGSGVYDEIDVAVTANMIGSLTLSNSTLALAKGSSHKLIPTVLDAAGNPYSGSAKLIWTSSSAKIATVSESGEVIATGKGTATITCTAGDGSGKKATCKVTVAVNPEEIQITGPKSIFPGGKAVLKATVLPADTANKNLVWSVISGDATVAKGTVTAGPGASGIIAVKAASQADGSIYATYNLAVLQGKVTSVDIHETAVTLFTESMINSGLDADAGYNMDETYYNLSWEVNGTSGFSEDVIWTTSNAKVATVSEFGTVTAVSPGTAVITATSADGTNKKDTCKVTVVVPAARVTVTTTAPLMVYNYPTLGAGKSAQFKATLGSTFGTPTVKTVKWSVSYYDSPDDWDADYIEQYIMPYVTITQSGKLTVNSKAANYLYDIYYETFTVRVKAEATDGSGTYGEMLVDIVPLTTYINFTNTSGSKLTSAYAYLEDEVVYVFFDTDSYYMDYTLTSSNPKVAGTITYDYKSGYGQYVVIQLQSRGTTNITILANDGSGKKATLKLTVY